MKLWSHPIPAPSSSTRYPVRGGSMERISGSSCSVSSLARESSIISSTVAALECSFQNSVMLQRTVEQNNVCKHKRHGGQPNKSTSHCWCWEINAAVLIYMKLSRQQQVIEQFEHQKDPRQWKNTFYVSHVSWIYLETNLCCSYSVYGLHFISCY